MKNTWEEIRGQFSGYIASNFEFNLRGNLRTALDDDLWRYLRAPLVISLWANLRDAICEHLKEVL